MTFSHLQNAPIVKKWTQLVHNHARKKTENKKKHHENSSNNKKVYTIFCAIIFNVIFSSSSLSVHFYLHLHCHIIRSFWRIFSWIYWIYVALLFAGEVGRGWPSNRAEIRLAIKAGTQKICTRKRNYNLKVGAGILFVVKFQFKFLKIVSLFLISCSEL